LESAELELQRPESLLPASSVPRTPDRTAERPVPWLDDIDALLTHSSEADDGYSVLPDVDALDHHGESLERGDSETDISRPLEEPLVLECSGTQHSLMRNVQNIRAAHQQLITVTESSPLTTWGEVRQAVASKLAETSFGDGTEEAWPGIWLHLFRGLDAPMASVLQVTAPCVCRHVFRGYNKHAVCRHGLSWLMHLTRQQTRPQRVR
jgi:hypothetical protein